MKRRILPLLFCILMPFSFAFSACSGGVQESTEPSSQEISKSESKAEESLLGSEAESANGDASEGNDDKSEFSDESNNDKSESDTSDGDGEYDGDTGNAPITRPSGYPTLCGSFMQPYAFKDYSEAQMISHLQAMYDVGIDILILQWSFTTENGVVTDAYFESSFEENEYSADCDKSGAKLVETILSAAEKVGGRQGQQQGKPREGGDGPPQRKPGIGHDQVGGEGQRRIDKDIYNSFVYIFCLKLRNIGSNPNV